MHLPRLLAATALTLAPALALAQGAPALVPAPDRAPGGSAAPAGTRHGDAATQRQLNGVDGRAPLANPVFPGTVTAPSATVPGPLSAGTLEGDASEARVAVPGGVPRSQRARAADRVTLEDYGGAGDWNGTAGTDNLAAWAKATATGKCLDMLSGRYWFSARPAPIVNRRACVQGRGRGSTALIVPGAGIEVSQSDYTTPILFDGFSLQTLGQEVGPGIKITQPQPDGLTSINRTNIWLANLDVGGVNQADSGFLRCFHFVNAQTPEGNDVRCRGRQDVTLATMARFTKMKDGLLAEHTGAKIGGAPRFKMLNVNAAEYGARIVGRAEGGDFQQPYIEAAVVGIANLMADARPGLSVRGGHINVTRAAVQLVNTPNCFVDGIQVYKFDKSGVANDDPSALPRGIVDAGETVGVLLDKSNTCVIGRNIFNAGAIQAVDASGAYTMVRLLDSYGVSVAPQRGIYITRGVSLRGVSQSNDIARPEIVQPYASTARPYRPYANDNTGIQNNVYLGGGVRLAGASNTSAVSVTGTAAFAASLPSMNVEVGQRIRVDASLAATTGATAGPYTAYLTQAGGTAAGAWIHSGNAVAQRSGSIAAGADWASTWSAEFVVSGRGTLVLGLAVAGPSATVAAGQAQMAATAP